MDFVAFDFETADRGNSSPCSIGFTVVHDNKIVDCKHILINPACEFNPYAIKVHGITPEMVTDAPLFYQIWPDIEHYFTDYPLVAHNMEFDFSVLRKACLKYGIPVPASPSFYCTMKIAQQNGLPCCKLDALCSLFSIVLTNHHNAAEDSKACAELMIKMLSNPTYETFPCDIQPYADQQNVCNLIYPDLEYDHVDIEYKDRRFVCTGNIEGYSRDQIISTIEACGGVVANSVSKKVDYLIVGLEDPSVIKSANGKSTKILKAEELRAAGSKVKIVTASDFLLSLAEEGIPIMSEDPYLELTKLLGLTPPFAREAKELFYNDWRSKSTVPCKVVSLVSEVPQVVRISIPGAEFDIALDYLKDMQLNVRVDEEAISEHTSGDMLESADDQEVCEKQQKARPKRKTTTREAEVSHSDKCILQIIAALIGDDYLSSGKLSVRVNKNPPNSIVYTAVHLAYRETAGEQLLCNVKTSGKEDCRYILFSEFYTNRLNDYNVPFSTIPSNPSPRVAIETFTSFCSSQPEKASDLFREILESGFSFERFDCCSRYKECSKAGKCIHPDSIYATACGYRRNLKRGKIFY